MERIWSSSNNDSLGIRKFSNTLNLKVGQRVYGRIISMSENHQAIIRLLNGTELQADIEGLIGDFENILMNFKVEGLKDGKLQLKIVQNQSRNQSKDASNDLIKFIAKEGLSKDDMPMLEGMLKYNIPLTKENISEVKGLIQFKQKLTENPEQAKGFVEKYINSKNIPLDSPKAEAISNKITDFLNNFKNMEMDNILLFLENDIDFSSESINNYNRMFKGNESIFKVVEGLAKGVEDLDIINPKTIQDTPIEFKESIVPKEIEGLWKNKPEITKALTSMLNENNFVINSKSSEVLYNIIDKTIEEIINQNVKSETNIKEGAVERVFTKLMLETKLSEVVGQKITVSDESFEKLSQMLDLKSNNENTQQDRSVFTKEVLKEIIVNKESESKEVIKNLISLIKSEADGEEQGALMQLIKSSINEVKLFNKFSDNYYYLNIPLNFKEKEYPCKLVIKDDRKDGKKIDSKNLKLALNINTGNLGNINSFVKINNSNMNIEIQCEKSYIKVFDLTKHKLKDRIEENGFRVNIIVTKAKEEFSLSSCREFFGDNNIAGIDITV